VPNLPPAAAEQAAAVMPLVQPVLVAPVVQERLELLVVVPVVQEPVLVALV
jgi:hypothetical protein